MHVGAIDGKHITMKKPKKSGIDYKQLEGFLYHSDLSEKIEDGTLGLPPMEPLGMGGPNLHYFLLGDDAFALIPWMVKPYSSRQLTRERIANYRISRDRRVMENKFDILVSRFRVLLGTMEQRPKVVRHCFCMCGVAQHAKDTPGLSR